MLLVPTDRSIKHKLLVRLILKTRRYNLPIIKDERRAITIDYSDINKFNLDEVEKLHKLPKAHARRNKQPE